MKQQGGVLLSLLILALIIVGTVFVFKASQNSLPGELLYPIKQQTEDFIVSTTEFRHAGRALTHIRFANERLNELETLEQKGASTKELMPIVERFWKIEQDAFTELRLGREVGDNVLEGNQKLKELGKRQDVIFQRLLEKTPAPEFYILLDIQEQSKKLIGI